MPDVYDLAFPAVDSAVVAKLRNFATAGIDSTSIVNSIVTAESNNLNNSFDIAEQNNAQAIQYGTLLSRNRTIGDVARDVIEKNKKINRGARDTYSRQSEINEWQAQNKLDTLFFLQAAFLYFCVLVVLFYLRQMSILPSTALWILMGTLTVILIGILYNRAMYTNNSRDKRFWNRRFIGLDDAGAGLRAKLQCSS